MAAKKAKDEEAKKPKKAPASKSKETKAKAPAKEKAPAKAKKEKAEVPAGPKKFSARSVMLDELAEIEKKSDLVSHGFGRYCKRLSTGVLAVDMYLDGGLIPGELHFGPGLQGGNVFEVFLQGEDALVALLELDEFRNVWKHACLM